MHNTACIHDTQRGQATGAHPEKQGALLVQIVSPVSSVRTARQMITSIPAINEFEVVICQGCRTRKRMYTPPYCDGCWYIHPDDKPRTIRWAVRRHLFNRERIMTCGHRHMTWLAAVQCAFSLMDKTVRDDPKAIRHWLGRIILAPEE